MKVIFTKKDGTKMEHTIDFRNNELIDFSFEEDELKRENLAGTLQDTVYLSSIPFIRLASKAASDMDQVKEIKKIFIKGMSDLLDKAMEDDAPIGDALRAKKGSELYDFMEDIYKFWLDEIGFRTDTLLIDFRDYRFVELIPTVELWFTLEMVFENADGNRRQLPMLRMLDYETASDDDIKRHATFCLLTAVVVLDKLGYDPNPLRPMDDLTAFEDKYLQIVKDSIEQNQ